MKKKYLLALLWMVLIEGVGALWLLMGMRFDAGRGHLINYASMKYALAGLIGLALVALMVAIVTLMRNAQWGQRVSADLDIRLVGAKKRLFFIQGALLVVALLLFEFFLLTYLAFPVPLRPAFLWAAIIALQTWIILRIAYAKAYRERPDLLTRLKGKWNEWLPVQRRALAILAVLGLVYFLFFIRFNLFPDPSGKFYLLGDEQVIYPDVVKIFVPQPGFAATVQNVLGTWGWWYGYPYLPISASVLIVPRLIFGSHFADQIDLNVGLLRQFVSVLPMVLALMLAVYILTRYKSVLTSVGMFVFLMLVPGIVKINYQFWHPDSIILLLVLLTIFFLQKDKLRFGKYFYLAALTCGLATAIKLFGLFFVLAIAGYLLAGLLLKKRSLGKLALAGLYFILIMVGTIVITSPSLLVPYVTRTALASWTDQQQKILLGPKGQDTAGLYETNLPNWLKYFGFHYMKAYFFYFAYFSLAAGSIWGSRKYLSRILLAWSVAISIFLVYFSAMKNFQYMLPVAVPLFIGASLLAGITQGNGDSKWAGWLSKPITRKIVVGVTAAFFASQLIINLVILYLFAVRGT